MKKSESSLRVQISLSKQAQENIKDITDVSKTTAMRELAQQFEQMRKAATMPVRDANLQMAKAIEATKVFDKLDLAKIAKRYQQEIDQIFKSQKRIANNLQFNQLQAIESLVQNMNEIRSELSAIVNIPSLQFAVPSQSILNSIPKIDFQNISQYPNNEYLEKEIQNFDADTFQGLLAQFEEKINRLPKGTIVAQGMNSKLERIVMYLMLLFQILNYLHNRQTSDQNEVIIGEEKQAKEYLESLEKFTEKIYPQLETLVDEKKEENLFVVIKTSTLRVSPTSKSDTLATVFPNQLVDILKEEKRWFYIEYFDHREEIPRMGWIYKGNVNNYTRDQ
jgi:hypothetical protein